MASNTSVSRVSKCYDPSYHGHRKKTLASLGTVAEDSVVHCSEKLAGTSSYILWQWFILPTHPGSSTCARAATCYTVTVLHQGLFGHGQVSLGKFLAVFNL